MRLTRSLIALAVLAGSMPRGTLADDERNSPGVRAEPQPHPYPPAPDARSVPDEPRRDAIGPYPRSEPAPQYAPRPYAGRRYYRPRVWWGWGWGWYPLYSYAPGPYADVGEPPRDREEANQVYGRLSLYGAGRMDGYVAGLELGIEGRYAGFDLDANALASEQVTGPLHHDGNDPIGWGTAHVTWSLLSERSLRLRVETGASMLALPSSDFVASREWRGKTVFGPDVGVSGQLGLLGPVGLEGHARLTPFPVRTADTFLGLVLHEGPLGVSAGWRWIDVAGDEKDAPKVWFRGPQVGLSFAL
jgi:hypothetical protein